MIYNSVITRKYYQIGVRHRCISTSQYFRSLAAKSLRELDTLMLFYDFISYCIIYYVVCMRSVHYHTEIACFEPISHTYVLCLTLGLENHLNSRSLTSWEGSCPDVEAVENSSVSLQQESQNLEICDSMFQLIPLYV